MLFEQPMLYSWPLRLSGLEAKPQPSNLSVSINDCGKQLLVKGFRLYPKPQFLLSKVPDTFYGKGGGDFLLGVIRIDPGKKITAL